MSGDKELTQKVMFETFGVSPKIDFEDAVSGALDDEGFGAGEVDGMSDAIGADEVDDMSDPITFWSFFDIITQIKLWAIYEHAINAMITTANKVLKKKKWKCLSFVILPSV